MTGKIAWKLSFTIILRSIISILANIPILFAVSPQNNSYIYMLGFYFLIGAAGIAIDVLLHRTRRVFFSGLIAFAIFAGIVLFIVKPCVDTIHAIFAPEAGPQPHELSNPHLAALFYVFIIVLVLPLLIGLVFSGREPQKHYIPRLCGAAFWTSIYLAIVGIAISTSNLRSFQWFYLEIYLVGAALFAWPAEVGQFLRILPEKYFQTER